MECKSGFAPFYESIHAFYIGVIPLKSGYTISKKV